MATPAADHMTVLLFGIARERVGASTVDVLLAPGADVARLRTALAAAAPELAPVLPSCRVAVDGEYAGEDTEVPPGAEVAVIPPVAGGRDDDALRVELTTAPIDVAAVHRAVADPRAGGNTVFVGTVRDHHEGRAVDHLVYEAYESMARRQIEAILAAASARFGLRRALCVHRLGRLEIGDAAIAVGTSADHRGETFAAVAWIMDAIKHDAPIFKRETYADGSHAWVRCTHVGDHEHHHDPATDPARAEEHP